MSGKKLGQLCREVLPPGYARVQKFAPVIQEWLEQQLPEPLNTQVSLLTLNADEIVIAGHSPLVANYLRLHAETLQEQLREALSLTQRVRFRSVPASLLKVRQEGENRQPEAASKESIAALERSAEWIEDEGLRDAMRSLARSMKGDRSNQVD